MPRAPGIAAVQCQTPLVLIPWKSRYTILHGLLYNFTPRFIFLAQDLIKNDPLNFFHNKIYLKNSTAYFLCLTDRHLRSRKARDILHIGLSPFVANPAPTGNQACSKRGAFHSLPTFAFGKSGESQGLGGFLRPGATAKDISKLEMRKPFIPIDFSGRINYSLWSPERKKKPKRRRGK
jgi:hypothetical protein